MAKNESQAGVSGVTQMVDASPKDEPRPARIHIRGEEPKRDECPHLGGAIVRRVGNSLSFYVVNAEGERRDDLRAFVSENGRIEIEKV